MRKNFSITELCEALGVSRSGYHSLGKREQSKRRSANEQLLHQIRIIHSDRHTRCYGSPRMTRELRALGIGCWRIVSQESCVQRICELVPGAFPPKTTQPDHATHSFRICYRKVGSPSARGAQLVSDIACISTGKAGSIWLWSSICSPAPFSAGNCLTLCTPIWSSVPPHAPSSQASCPGSNLSLRSRLPISATITRELLARHGLRKA